MDRTMVLELRERARWHIAAGARLTAKQTKLVAHLQSDGQATGKAQEQLRELEVSQERRLTGLDCLEREWAQFKNPETAYYCGPLLSHLSRARLGVSSSKDSARR